MAEQQHDVDALKRRGRRRLVGAVALVLAAVIVLPMVFDPEPRPTVPPVSVRIPGEDEAPFKPKPPPARPAENPQPPAKPESVAKPQTAAKPPVDAKAQKQEEFIVQVGAFANPDAVVAALKRAKLPYYTESLPGNLTRVRAGPFASKDAAEKALQRMKGLGLEPGPVATRDE